MNLLERLPPSFQAGPEMAEIQRVLGVFIKRLWDDLEVWKAQFDIETATIGLPLYEQIHGILTDLTLSLDWRRSKIKAKRQGLGVSTPAMIASIVARFTGGDAHVEELPADYIIKVVVDGVLNPPEDMDVMRHSVAEIKPAHLAHEYAINYQSGQQPAGCAMLLQQAKRYQFALEGLS